MEIEIMMHVGSQSQEDLFLTMMYIWNLMIDGLIGATWLIVIMSMNKQDILLG